MPVSEQHPPLPYINLLTECDSHLIVDVITAGLLIDPTASLQPASHGLS